MMKKSKDLKKEKLLPKMKFKHLEMFMGCTDYTLEMVKEVMPARELMLLIS